MAAAGGATPRTIRVGGVHRCSHAYISHTLIFRRRTARPADVGVLNATVGASPPASTETPHQLLAARRADAATLIEWLQLRDGTVLGVDLVYEQRPDGSLGRTLIATQVCKQTGLRAAARQPAGPADCSSHYSLHTRNCTAGLGSRRCARGCSAVVYAALCAARRRQW